MPGYGGSNGKEYNIAKRARLKRYHAAKNDAFKYAAETGADKWLDPWINTPEELVSHTENGLAVQSREIIYLFFEQVRFFVLPVFQRDDGCDMAQRFLRDVVVIDTHISLHGLS